MLYPAAFEMAAPAAAQADSAATALQTPGEEDWAFWVCDEGLIHKAYGMRSPMHKPLDPLG